MTDCQKDVACLLAIALADVGVAWWTYPTLGGVFTWVYGVTAGVTVLWAAGKALWCDCGGGGE